MPYIFPLIALGRLLAMLLRWVLKTLRARSPIFDDWVKRTVKANSQRLEKITLILFLVIILVCVALLLPFISIGQSFIYSDQRREARNPDTKPERLEELAQVRDRVTLRWVVRHPNTPPDVLLELGKEFPRELLANPVFDLLLLADLNLFETMPRATLKSLMLLTHIPLGYLERAAAMPDLGVEVAQVIAQHPRATEYLFEQIAQYSWDMEITRSLIERSTLSQTILDRMAESGFGGIKQLLALYFNLPKGALEKLVKAALTLQPAPSAVMLLSILAQEGNLPMQFYLLQQRSLPGSVLAALAQSAKAPIQLKLLQRPDLPIQVLEILEREGCIKVQLALLKRSDLPIQIQHHGRRS